MSLNRKFDLKKMAHVAEAKVVINAIADDPGLTRPQMIDIIGEIGVVCVERMAELKVEEEAFQKEQDQITQDEIEKEKGT